MTNNKGILPSGVVRKGNLTGAASDLIEVSAGLVFRDGLLLIAERRPQDHLGGLWEFPGGKREPGESPEDCLRRELMEELGIEVEIKELVETIAHDYPGKKVLLKFFRCLWRLHEPRAVGCHNFAWVGRDQLANYAFPAADERLLQKLLTTPDLWR
jgi:8-oxo-dGTP diphosphatase